MLEKNSLIASYTEKQLNDRAREDIPFDNSIIDLVKVAILILSKAKKKLDSEDCKIHITKATLTSWIYFFAHFQKHNNQSNEELTYFFYSFEKDRFIFKEEGVLNGVFDCSNLEQAKELLDEFNFRAVSRVMTGSSLLIRDFIISLFFIKSYPRQSESFDLMKNANLDKAIDVLINKDKNDLITLVNNYSDAVLAGVTVCR